MKTRSTAKDAFWLLSCRDENWEENRKIGRRGIALS